MNHYFCLQCGHHATSEEGLKHDCNKNNVANFSYLKSEFNPVKRSLYASFRDWVIENFMFLLTLCAGITVNQIILCNVNWSDHDKLIESICMGIILPRIFK